MPRHQRVAGLVTAALLFVPVPLYPQGIYAVGTWGSGKAYEESPDRAIGIVAPLNSFEPKITPQEYEERYPNLQILKKNLSHDQAFDWMCSQTTIRYHVPAHMTTRDRRLTEISQVYVFRGQPYLRGMGKGAVECMFWHGPVSKIPIPPDNAAAASTPVSPAPANPLGFPPNLTGPLQDCLKQSVIPDRPKYAPDTRAAAWQAAFDRDWQENTRGSGAYQQQMLQQGNVWVEGRGWVEGRTLLNEQQACVANHLRQQIVRLQSGLPTEQQLMISNIARQIMAEGDPAARLAQLQRLRRGTFLMLSAEADRTMADVYNLEATQVMVDAVTMVVPIVNDGRAFYEVTSGRDAWTGRELSWWERALNGGGLILGYGVAAKELLAALRPAEEALAAGRMTAKEARLLEASLQSGGKMPEEVKALIPFYEARDAAAAGIRQNAARKVEAYAAAVQSGDPARIGKALMEVKGDRQAITLLNGKEEALRRTFNDHIGNVYHEVDEVVKKRVAERYSQKIAEAGVAEDGLRAEDVTIFSASNPSKSVKVGRDRDYTIRIGGQDLPSKEAREFYEQALYDTLKSKGMLPAGVRTPRQLGEKLDQTAVHWLDAEAYNRKDLSIVLNPAEKGVPLTERRLMTDVRQVGDTMEFKGTENFAKAAQSRKAGQLGQAEEFMMEGMYQTRKQFDNQLLGRIQASLSRRPIDFQKLEMAPELRSAINHARASGYEGVARNLELQALVPERLRQQIEIFRKVETAGWSPPQVEAVLRQVFQSTPGDVARQLKEAVIEWEMRVMGGK